MIRSEIDSIADILIVYTKPCLFYKNISINLLILTKFNRHIDGFIFYFEITLIDNLQKQKIGLKNG